jgi:hypothetical protein
MNEEGRIQKKTQTSTDRLMDGVNAMDWRFHISNLRLDSLSPPLRFAATRDAEEPEQGEETKSPER